MTNCHLSVKDKFKIGQIKMDFINLMNKDKRITFQDLRISFCYMGSPALRRSTHLLPAPPETIRTEHPMQKHSRRATTNSEVTHKSVPDPFNTTMATSPSSSPVFSIN